MATGNNDQCKADFTHCFRISRTHQKQKTKTHKFLQFHRHVKTKKTKQKWEQERKGRMSSSLLRVGSSVVDVVGRGDDGDVEFELGS